MQRYLRPEVGKLVIAVLVVFISNGACHCILNPFQGAGRKTDLIARQQTQIGGAGGNVVPLLHDSFLRTALDALNFSFCIGVYGLLHGRGGMKSGFHGLHFQFFNKDFGAGVLFVVHHAGTVHAGDNGVVVVCKDFGGDKGVMGSLH